MPEATWTLDRIVVAVEVFILFQLTKKGTFLPGGLFQNLLSTIKNKLKSIPNRKNMLIQMNEKLEKEMNDKDRVI